MYCYYDRIIVTEDQTGLRILPNMKSLGKIIRKNCKRIL